MWVDASKLTDSGIESPCLGCPKFDRLPKCIKKCNRRAGFIAAEVPTLTEQDPAVRGLYIRRFVESCLR